MTEEIEDKGIAIPNEEAPVYTEIEQQAIDNGWNPEGVEGKEHLTAKEFMGRKPIYDDIRSLKKAHRKDRESIEAMKGMLEGIREQERNRLQAELNAQKKAALENEDYDTVLELDERIAQNKANTGPIVNPAFDSWLEDNEWYNTDVEARNHAETLAAGYLAKHGKDVPPADVFNYITTEVKARFPEKFETKPRPSPVEGASKGRAAGGHASLSDLTAQERDIANTLIRNGEFKNEAEYMKFYSEG